jgi:phosphate starvation-inducible PhoH-like protein
MTRKRITASAEALLPRFEPRNAAQQEAFDLYKRNSILFLLGPAGTGKTHLAVYFALYDLLSHVKTMPINKIVLTRPMVEAGEKLGFLPGDLEEKAHPFMLPIYDCVGKMTWKPEAFIDEYIEIAPLAFMRGRTFDNAVAILDEAQNCTEAQLKLFLTRPGENCKLIITGDPDQTDIGDQSFLKTIAAALEPEPGIAAYRFKDADIVRNRLVERVLKRWPRTPVRRVRI